ncbi:hypothetical protein [Helicobacter pylori]
MDCFWFVARMISQIFLREAFCNHFPQKLKGLLVKVGLFLSFGAFACG